MFKSISLLAVVLFGCGLSHPEDSDPPVERPERTGRPEPIPPASLDDCEATRVLPPSLRAPAAGATVTSTPSFQVDSPCGGFYLEVCSDEECADPVASKSVFAANGWTIDQPLTSGRYYWRAKVLNRRNHSDFAPTRAFVVDATEWACEGSCERGGSDFNGDGFADVVALRARDYYNGTEVSYGGRSTRTVVQAHGPSLCSGSAWAKAFAAVGDVDGDGFDDLLSYCQCQRGCGGEDFHSGNSLTLFRGSPEGLPSGFGAEQQVTHWVRDNGEYARLFPL
ncbi:MAG: FG-GAP-like repeat-containing protein, partial [Myxococcota bacterium]